MTKQLKIQSIEVEQGGLKYRSHPERKKSVGEDGGGCMVGDGGVASSWKQRCCGVHLAINTYSTSCAEVVVAVTSLK